ncbi:helix-turn-helix domain-containing protein [Azospirillum sp. B4]|uniref:helix-turn-helix domain-containing protein n=1 Tax=Azospirillum sp. B4 TaxID=95605 RepID=UPI0005C988AA|nr:helix-turn-helix transcriptional regulator [Azospirillum sp. B4]
MTRLKDRLRQVREHFGETQKSMSARFALGVNTWQGYERLGKLPKGETLAQLLELDISVDWLLTGHGNMHLTGNRPGLDALLLGHIIDGVLALRTQDGSRPAPAEQGQLISRIYDRLIAIPDERERRGALRYALEQTREDLFGLVAEEP